MTNRNLEDIDKLFREGLTPEKTLVTYQDEDWSKLKKRLDRNEKKKRGIIWLSRLGGVAALFLLFFVLWMLLPEGRNRVIQQAEVQQKDQKVKKEPDQSIVTNEAEKIVSQTKPDSSKWLAQNKTLKESPLKKRLIVPGLEKGTADQDTLGVESLNIQKATKALTDQSKELSSLQPDIVKSPDGKGTSEYDTLRVDNLNAQKATTAPKVSMKEHNQPQPDIVKPPEREPSSAEESLFAALEEPNDQLKQERSIRKLALSVLAAPDYNGVNNLNNASLGNDFGLMVSFEILKNWSFSTGGIYAKKLYETGFSNYDPVKNIWNRYYPKSVNADCRVLDIPLNINYKFLHRKNTAMSIGSGISSYIMLREDYRFSYTENRPNSPQTYQVINENQHWLSVLNLQANFEQRLNSRLSIGLQPYMKIPFKNIGFAGVKLQSLGMAVNLNWNFNL